MAYIGTNVFLGGTLVGQTYLGDTRIEYSPFDYQQATYTTSGSVVILDASSSASYPGTGNTWFDLSGYGNNASLTNMAGNYTSANGGYFDFPNSLSNYMTITQSGSLNNAFVGDFTIDVWITIDSFQTGASDWTSPFGKGAAASYMATLINRDSAAPSNRGLNRLYYADTFTQPATNLTLTAGAWFNWQIVRSGSTITYYRNATSLGSGTNGSNMSNTQNLTLGYGFSAGSYPFDGKMGWFAVYNRALTTTELTQNYNVIKTRYGL